MYQNKSEKFKIKERNKYIVYIKLIESYCYATNNSSYSVIYIDPTSSIPIELFKTTDYLQANNYVSQFIYNYKIVYKNIWCIEYISSCMYKISSKDGIVDNLEVILND